MTFLRLLRKYKYKFAIGGFFIGLAFLVLNYTFILSEESQRFIQVHRDTNYFFLWILNTLPILLGLVGFILGRITGRLAENLKEEQSKLVQMSKLALLGEMSGGLAHEINNPLTVMKACATKLVNNFENNKLDHEKSLHLAKKINMTVDRAASIARGLKDFARDESCDNFKEVKLKDIIDETLIMCTDNLELSQIRVEVKVDDDIFINCLSTQVSQVLINLLGNAIDAIKEHKEKWINLYSERLDDFVKIVVIDSGTGIDENVLEKIFKPFFTTKGKGKGTGLGMSISKGIIEGHHGSLEYQLNNGHTSFVIMLPMSSNRKKIPA
jgi:C4-dicarboxylate-specific signal transduction histidine kinase